MRSVCKGLFASLVAVLALGAASSAAMGAGWSVNGSTTFGTEALSSSPSGVGIALEMESEGILRTCETLELQGGKIVGGSAEGSATAMVFSGCRQWNESESCEMSASIKTVAVTIDAINATEVEIKPKSPATEFGKYKIKGGGCVLNGTYTLTGDFRATVEKAGTEALGHVTAFNRQSNLQVGAGAINVKGNSLLKLVSGKDWSIQ